MRTKKKKTNHAEVMRSHPKEKALKAVPKKTTAKKHGRPRGVLDRKFELLAVNPTNGKIYTQANAVVFAAHDAAFPVALSAYIEECKKIGATESQIVGATALLLRVKAFQKKVAKKVPDIVGNDEYERVLFGKGL